ncbi:MAG: hypothetical protein CSA76_00885 [Spirochaetales bacterium]|nr:MAG: hypothetical protein CSA76_00885 [Spirochaetales bacterium]
MNPADNLYSQFPFLLEDINAVKGVMAESLAGGNAEAKEALSRFVESPGKMLRPLLLVLGARMGNFQAEKTYRLAASVEMLHIATLIHDDIVDNSPLRRGQPTLHTTEGVHKAVLLGDYLFTLCFRLVADYALPESARMLAGSVGQICQSEMSQVRTGQITKRRYLRTIYGKTALLFMMALGMGGAENGCPKEVQSLLRSIGYGIGAGFQIQDDILDYSGTQDEMGKPAGNDSLDSLRTLPLILAMNKGNTRLGRLISLSVGKHRAGKIRREVAASGALEEAAAAAGYYFDGALKLTERLPRGDAKDALVCLIEAMRNRKK